jgi:hypothetical protein
MEGRVMMAAEVGECLLELPASIPVLTPPLTHLILLPPQHTSTSINEIIEVHMLWSNKTSYHT